MVIVKFDTAEEYRAYNDGALDIINLVLKNAAELWKIGRDSYDLERLKDEMNIELKKVSDYAKEAYKLENK